MRVSKEPAFKKYVEVILDACHEATFVDSKTGIQKRKLARSVRGFVEDRYELLKRYTAAYESGVIDEQNYQFLLKATATTLYLVLQKKKSIRRTNVQYVMNQIPAMIFGAVKAAVSVL